MSIVWIVMIVMTLFAILLLWVSIRLFIKCFSLDETITRTQDLLNNRDEYIQSVLGGLNKILQNLDQLHAREMFENDDDVGILWNLMREQIIQLQGFVNNMEEDETGEQSTK